jgi:LPS export ABC transporter protein LptC
MHSKIKVRLLFFIFIISNTSAFGGSSENNILIKDQLYNFSTIKKNKNMTIDWKLKGSILKKYINDITVIENPFLNIYKTQSTIDIKSDMAIDPSGNMKEIYLKNNVFISREYFSDNAPMKMYTSYGIFYVSQNLFETDRDITIITSDSTTTGSGLSANMETGIIRILSNAKRIIRENDKSRIIEGNQMIYDANEEKWIVKDKAANDLKKTITKKVSTTFNTK